MNFILNIIKSRQLILAAGIRHDEIATLQVLHSFVFA